MVLCDHAPSGPVFGIAGKCGDATSKSGDPSLKKSPSDSDSGPTEESTLTSPLDIAAPTDGDRCYLSME